MNHRIAIHPALTPYVRAILIEDRPGGGPATTEPYKVLPSPFPVTGFQYRGRLEVLRGTSAETLERGGITGLQTSFRRFKPASDTCMVLAVLQPFDAFALLGFPMSELTDAHVGLGSLLPGRQLDPAEDRLAAAASVHDISQAVQAFLLALLERSRHLPHPIVVEAAERILGGHGAERVGALLRDLTVGERQLERLFRRQIGVGPKQFTALARFQWVLRRLPKRRSWAELACEAGYADQAHFIRSFAARAGITPGEYVRELPSS